MTTHAYAPGTAPALPPPPFPRPVRVAPVPRHAAPDVEERDEDQGLSILKMPMVEESRTKSTPVVIVAAMFFLTLCVLIVTIAGDARDGAVLAGSSMIIGVVLAVVFRKRWH